MDTENENADLIAEQLKDASPERLEAIKVMMSMDDERALIFGEALSIADAGYNLVEIKNALHKSRERQGPKIVRTRTAVRIFGIPVDEDDLESSDFAYRGFYVKMPTSEQIVAINQDAASRVAYLSKKGLNIPDDMQDVDDKEKYKEAMLSFMESNEFRDMLTEPAKIFRQITIENTVEVEIGDDCSPTKPLLVISVGELSEAMVSELEQDLRLLVSEQGVMLKNLPGASMLGF